MEDSSDLKTFYTVLNRDYVFLAVRLNVEYL